MVKIVNDYVYKKWDNLKLNDEINFSDNLQVVILDQNIFVRGIKRYLFFVI